MKKNEPKKSNPAKAGKAKPKPVAKAPESKEAARARIKKDINGKIQKRISDKEKARKKTAAKKPRTAPKPKPAPRKRANPATAEEITQTGITGYQSLSRAWRAWTGADPGQTLRLNLVDGLGDCPSDVVLLGRLTKLITASGQVEAYSNGPFLVSDASLKRVWLIDRRSRSIHLDLKGGLIGYLAKKPKFGDRAAVEYIHLFQNAARVEMAGQVGRLTGKFRLTPQGIEG